MLQKLICHFSIKMLKIFCLRDPPSAWLRVIAHLTTKKIVESL